MKLTHKIIFYVHNETEISDLKICASVMASSVFITWILVRINENVGCRMIAIFQYDQGLNLGLKVFILLHYSIPVVQLVSNKSSNQPILSFKPEKIIFFSIFVVRVT